MVHKSPLGNAVTGFRFELLWVWLFASVISGMKMMDKREKKELKEFSGQLQKYIWYGFVPVVIITFVGFLIGQEKVLEFFGFGLENSELVVKAPLAHVIDGGGYNESLRLSGGFSTPNHFAGYLLFLLGLSLGNFYVAMRKRIWGVISLVILTLIILSFARFSWLGALMIVLALVVLKLLTRLKAKKYLHKISIGIIILTPLLIGLVGINLPYDKLVNNLPSWIAKPSSTSLHRMHTMTSIDILKEDPSKIIFGYGLGVSGPAAKEIYNNLYNNPLVDKYYYIPYRWGLLERDMLIPENWFLQVLINGGVFYLTLYCLIVLLPIKKLLDELNQKYYNYPKISILLSMIAIIIGNLFLHIWENQTIVIYWSLVWIILVGLENFKNTSKITGMTNCEKSIWAETKEID
ncbi:hypothetical protein HC864_04330 [Candidatus Gracilibacteria bacterium]|nr:hypothetical protein [Candidatus Gracilibacteria bacterium]